jgi:hypothetical protein
LLYINIHLYITKEGNMKIKLKRLHKPNAHMGKNYNHYKHDSTKSEYGYDDFRIRASDLDGDWNVYTKDGKQLNPRVPMGLTFKQARQWLENYLSK